jgi:nucleoid DNA-binding protein
MQSDLSRREVAEIVEGAFQQIADTLVIGEAVKISRFASFIPRRSPPRIGRNPKRPDDVHAIPAKVKIRFRAANELKHHVRTGEPE